jgi:membrane-associated phospholipid phosphatase
MAALQGVVRAPTWRMCVVLLATGAMATLTPGSAASQSLFPAHNSHLRWWHGLAAVGGYALLTTLDQGVRRTISDTRSEHTDNVSLVARQMGEPEVYVTAGLGVLAAGLVSGNQGIKDAGLRITSSLAITGVLVTAAKFTAGRARPSRSGSEADDFSPFSGNSSAPSGHSAMAFALATSLSDEIKSRWATVALYTLAAGTAWSRVNDEVHWFSDVVAGAAVGVATAKFVNGKLTLFGVRAPTFTPSSSGVTLSWQGSF